MQEQVFSMHDVYPTYYQQYSYLYFGPPRIKSFKAPQAFTQTSPEQWPWIKQSINAVIDHMTTIGRLAQLVRAWC
jgi:hypothetical protein